MFVIVCSEVGDTRLYIGSSIDRARPIDGINRKCDYSHSGENNNTDDKLLH